MSKKRSPREMAKNMKRFIEGARANGTGEETAQAIWELIANFAAYAYCKAHAATYGELAYQCAYLKAHYPAEFFAAVLSNRGGFYTPPVYLEEAKRQGLAVRPPHVNHSGFEYRVEDGMLRIGFVEVRDLTEETVRALLDARADGPFFDLPDFQARTGAPRADVEALLHAGAFDGLPESAPLTRPMQWWQFRALYAKRHKPRGSTDENLFKQTETGRLLSMPDYSRKRRSGLEWEALALMTSGHPLDYFLHQLQERPLVASTDLSAYAGQVVTLTGWLVTERRLAVKSGAGVMKFLTLEDTCGAYEAVLFPEVYQAYGHLLTTHGPYLLTGEAQLEHGAPALRVTHVEVAPGERTWKLGAPDR